MLEICNTYQITLHWRNKFRGLFSDTVLNQRKCVKTNKINIFKSCKNWKDGLYWEVKELYVWVSRVSNLQGIECHSDWKIKIETYCQKNNIPNEMIKIFYILNKLKLWNLYWKSNLKKRMLLHNVHQKSCAQSYMKIKCK